MKIGISCEEFHQDELLNLLGTNFYKYAIKTNGGILLNPQKLCLGLVPKICKGIDVYEINAKRAFFAFFKIKKLLSKLISKNYKSNIFLSNISCEFFLRR